MLEKNCLRHKPTKDREIGRQHGKEWNFESWKASGQLVTRSADILRKLNHKSSMWTKCKLHGRISRKELWVTSNISESNSDGKKGG